MRRSPLSPCRTPCQPVPSAARTACTSGSSSSPGSQGARPAFAGRYISPARQCSPPKPPRAPRPSGCASLFPLVLAVKEIADELFALELAELHVRLDAPIERHADRPRARVDVRVFDGRLIRKVIGVHPADALHNVQAVCVIVARTIEKPDVDRSLGIQRANGPAHETL